MRPDPEGSGYLFVQALRLEAEWSGDVFVQALRPKAEWSGDVFVRALRLEETSDLSLRLPASGYLIFAGPITLLEVIGGCPWRARDG